MQKYDIATAITQARARIDQIYEHDPNPEKQALRLLFEGYEIAKKITISAAGGPKGLICHADLILLVLLHDAANKEPFWKMEFDGWPQRPGITFLIWGRDSARELLGVFLAATVAIVNRSCPNKIFNILNMPRPLASYYAKRLPVELFVAWGEAMGSKIKTELVLPTWRITQRECEIIDRIFEHETTAYFKSNKHYSLPLGMKNWSAIFGLGKNKMQELRDNGTYNFEQVSPRKWRLPIDELPAEYLEQYRAKIT